MKNKKPVIIILATAGAVVIAALCLAFFLKSAVREQFSDRRAYRTAQELEDYVPLVDEDLPVAIDFNEVDESLRAAELDAFTILNKERKNRGLQELAWDADLEWNAFIRSYELPAVFSHTRPDGSEWFTVNGKRIRAENIYKGYKEPEKFMASWMDNEADRENFFSGELTKCAFSVFEDAKGSYYWVLLFNAGEKE